MMIKKNNIALLAGLLIITVHIASFAEENMIYGDFRYSFNQIDNDVIDTTSGENNASRVGLKGQTEVYDGIMGFYNLQVGVNVDRSSDGDAFTQRLTWLVSKEILVS